MVMALKVATPIGDLELGSSPANAAGPDLRELVLGSEGAFGVITEVTLKVRPLPSDGLRGVALGVLHRRRRGDAPAGPGRPAGTRHADRAAAVRRERELR